MEPVDDNKPKRRTKAEREAWVAKWRESKQSVPAFAAKHGLASSSLYQWIKPPRGGERNKGKRTGGKPTFTEVKVTGVPASSPSVEASVTIALRGGQTITVDDASSVDPSWLAQVVKAVSAC